MEEDKIYEVTKKQFDTLMAKCAGFVAGRESGGKYFIKIWLCLDYVESVFNKI